MESFSNMANDFLSYKDYKEVKSIGVCLNG